MIEGIIIDKDNGGDEVIEAMPQSDGFLTTHVLDTSRGVPAAGLTISLYRFEGTELRLLNQCQTNADGRTDKPILPQADFTIGRYQLVFHAGAYLDAHYDDLPEPKFLDEVPITFGIADAQAHYHVPLLLSPFGYSTYRGS